MNFLTASVDIKVDDSKLPSQLARAKSAVIRTVDRMEGAFKRMSTAFISAWKKMTRYAKWAVLGIAAIATASIKMAADVIESENLYKESMGRMADATREWSKEMSKALYLNEFEVRKYVGTFNVMLLSMGIGEEQAAEMSRTMTQLTYDMASFYNLKTEEAFGKLQSGIVGMSRPLQALGILVKESTIEAYALRTGLIKEGQEMTELQKVLARYGTIMEATTKSQGDMLRTINESANVFRGLWSQVKLVAISFGDALLPAVTEVAKQMRDWLSANQQKAAELFVDVIEDMTLGIARFAEEIIAIPVYWKSFIIGIKEAQLVILKINDELVKIGIRGLWTTRITDKYINNIKRIENEIVQLTSEVDDLSDSYVNSGSKIRKFFNDLRREQAKPEAKSDVVITSGVDLIEQIEARFKAYEKGLEDYQIDMQHARGTNQEFVDSVVVGWDEIIKREQYYAQEFEHTMEEGDLLWQKMQDKMQATAERATEFAMSFRNVIASGFENSMRDADNWKDHMLNMFEELYWAAIRMAFLEPIAGVFAKGLTSGLGAVFGQGIFVTPAPTTPTVFTSPHGGSGLQHGGEVLETGWAKVHKGETYSGVQGGYGRGNLEVHIHNEGSEKLDISSAQEYMVSDRRIVDVTTKAMTTNKRFQNSIKQAAR